MVGDSILIVDDEVANLEALKRFILDTLDWNVFTAISEVTAKEILNKNEIDVVITDLVIDTEQSGIEVLRSAKERDPLTAVILVTAFEQMLNRSEAFELGAFDCISKTTPGVQKVEEIIIKAKAAISYRRMTLRLIKNEARLSKLKRYFDPGILNIIEEKQTLLDLRLKTLTVCFWDIRGFSGLCENLKAHPTMISGFLAEYFHLGADTIFSEQGVLDKFIGDGVMGLFGVLSALEDEGYQDAINAVNAAVKFREAFDDLIIKWKEKWAFFTPQSIHIGLGCGMHTGETLVGNIGTEMRDQFTALGPHVNLAQRLESRAEKGQILMSATTKARVSNNYIANKVYTLSDIKNIPGEFDIFEVVSSLNTK